MRTRFFRTATVSRLIEQLARDRDLRDALADALGDPTLDVAYWLPERGYVDRDGHAIDAAGRELTTIDHEGRRVGALLHATVLNETPELVVEASAAAALAIENARLEVELRARLEALRASRARLVEAGDAERRRLGRDLHDGAQQRLVALMIELQLARERLPAIPAGALELVDSAFANAQAAVGELRDLASGIHPAVLSQRGLDAALESLASRSPVPVELGSRVGGAAADRGRDRRLLRRRRGADQRGQVRGRDVRAAWTCGARTAARSSTCATTASAARTRAGGVGCAGSGTAWARSTGRSR